MAKPIVFKQTPSANAARLQLAQMTDKPLGMPMSEGHLLQSVAYMLADCGIHIGHDEGELDPVRLVNALTRGLAETRAGAYNDEQARQATIADGGTEPG